MLPQGLRQGPASLNAWEVRGFMPAIFVLQLIFVCIINQLTHGVIRQFSQPSISQHRP